MQFLDLGWFETGLRVVMAWLCSIIYPIITWLYNLFIYVSKVNILSDDVVKPIYQRVTLVLTIIMVFYVTFEFVKYVVQPDGIIDKEKGAGKLVYKMIIVVLLIAFVPTIFTSLYKFQNIIVEKNIIGKVFLGTKGGNFENYGGTFTRSMFENFYGLSDSKYEDEMCDDIPCSALIGMNLTSLEKNGTMPYITNGLAASSETTETHEGETLKVQQAYIEFNGLFAVAVGVFIAYILLIYCIDVGVRWAQLIYLQIIAPIAIIGYLAPSKDGMFQKWYKQCLTTYLDLFIRIAIINFVLLISNILLDEEIGAHLFSNLGDIGEWMKSFVVIVLVLGLLLFAQKAPKLLGELFPKMGAASGNFGLKGGERVAPMAARAIGAGAGGLNRLVKGGIARARNQHKRNQDIKERRMAEGKDISRKAVRQERRQADLDAKAARRKNRQALKDYNKEYKQTRKENDEVLAAEKELAEAKRSGDTTRISNANKRLTDAKAAQAYKKAELNARKELEEAQKSGNQQRIQNAREELNKITGNAARQAAVENTTTQVSNAKGNVDKLKRQREQQETAVNAARQNLEIAKKTGDATKIAAAEAELKEKIKERDGNLVIYDHEQQIEKHEKEIETNKSELNKLNQAVSQAKTADDEAQSKLANANAQLANVTADGDNNIAAAEEALEKAKQSGNAEQIALAQTALNKAYVDKNTAVSKAEKEVNEAKNAATATQNALNTATLERDKNKNTLETKIAEAESKKAREEIIKTRAEQSRASEKAIEKAEKDYQHATQKLNYQQEELDKSNSTITEKENLVREQYAAAKADYARAQSEKAEKQQQSYRSVAGNAALGAIGGGWTGAKTGWEAQKITEVSKKIQEGEKKDIENIKKHETWLDSGGTTLGSKIVSSVEKNIGTITDAQEHEREIKRMDTQIASNKRISAIEGSVKTNVDNAKSRSGSKLEAGEQKTSFTNLKPNENITYKDSAGNVETLELTEDERRNAKTSAIYEREKNKAKMAREQAQAAQQAYANAKAQGNVPEEKLKQLETEANAASANATREEQLLGQKKKALEEFAITSALRTPASLRRDTNYQPDQVLVEQVENSLQSIEESKRNADTYNKVMALLSKQNPAYAEAYRTGKIEDFDTLDKIQAALSTVKAQRDRDTATLETIAGINKASSQLDAEKAADAATGNK